MYGNWCVWAQEHLQGVETLSDDNNLAQNHTSIYNK